MKKFLSIAIAIIMVAGVLFLVGCDKGPEDTNTDVPANLKFGLGVVASYGDVKDASDEANGEGQVIVDVAAVLVDADGKIVKCVLDCADSKAAFTAEGAAVEAGEFKTKYEMGDSYNMVTYGGAKAEWYAQADSFAKLVEGKTIDEVKALVAEGDKGTAEVVNAGCTIMVADFVKSIEAAVKNAVDSKATADSTLKLGVVTSQTNKDASEEANGEIEIATTVVATALDAEGKVIVAKTDVAAAKLAFDAKGVSATDATAAIATKYEQGDNYNMVAYGGAKLEWYKQADAFSGALVGKNATEIGALVAEDGKGVADIQTAGCTIYVTDLVKAAVKAATK